VPSNTETPPAILNASHLTKRFGGLSAVDDVSFSVRDGEIFGVIGPNGAGKSVLINLISGFYPATAGTIRLCGQDIAGFSLHRVSRLGVARTFQNIRLLKRLTVIENVMTADQHHARHPLRAFFAFGAQRRPIERAMRYIELMGLTHCANQIAGTLPYGLARRLEIARALATDPQLLLLDEPAAGMNEEETKELVEDIERARTIVRAIVLIEHDMSLMQTLATRLMGMDFGRIIAEGSPGDVLRNPEIQRAYLGEDDEA
jgi:branched-chain amino acid transport system ATP-binding protein